MSQARLTQDEMIMQMLRDHERRQDRLMREAAALTVAADDSDAVLTEAHVHNVRRVRVSTSQMNTERAMTVDRECTVDLDSVHVRRTLKITKQRMIESDRQRDIRARETEYRAMIARISA